MRWVGRSALWALVLIGVGLFLLLRNADVIDEDVRIWPFLLVAVGLFLLVERLGRPWWFGGGLFVPFVLIALGVVEFLQDAGWLSEDFSIWPVILIAVGVAILVQGASWPGAQRAVVKRESIPTQGATEARVLIEHGAGELYVGSLGEPGTLLAGTFEGGVDSQVRSSGDLLDVRLRPPRGGVGRFPRFTHNWSIQLNGGIPLSLSLRGGASRSNLDLHDLTARDVDVECGASETTLTLPAGASSRVRIRGGAASVRVRVPQAVAAWIRVRGGISSVNVDSRPRRSGRSWMSRWARRASS
jgi:hypothetical protein